MESIEREQSDERGVMLSSRPGDYIIPDCCKEDWDTCPHKSQPIEEKRDENVI